VSVIAYVFLSAGVVGTAAVTIAVAPAGRGLHRHVVPRAALRAEAARHEAAAEDLGCKLVGLASEYDAVTADRNDKAAALEKASVRIAELEEQLRELTQLREANRALEAQLANARAVRPLPPHGDKPPTGSRPVPLGQTPFALSPGTQPS
jgi:hypothetical protein